MGIKDNFSQAVKELWKKDGQEEQTAQTPAAQPSELEGYLRQPEAAAAPDDGVQPQTDATTQFIQQPAQPVQPAQPAQNAAEQSIPQQPVRETNVAGIPLESPYYRTPPVQPAPQQAQPQQNFGGYGQQAQPFGQSPVGGYDANSGFGGGFVPPSSGDGMAMPAEEQTDEVTVISKNTIIDGNVRSLANMQVDGNIKGNVETTRNLDMTGKVVGDVTCNNASFASAAMQGNVTLKGRMRMDRDTILIGDLSSQYADINGRIRGKLDIAGKAELKRDAIVFGDINASTIAVTDGAIIQGYVNTTFLSKEDGRNAIPEKISFDTKD